MIFCQSCSRPTSAGMITCGNSYCQEYSYCLNVFNVEKGPQRRNALRRMDELQPAINRRRAAWESYALGDESHRDLAVIDAHAVPVVNSSRRPPPIRAAEASSKIEELEADWTCYFKNASELKEEIPSLDYNGPGWYLDNVDSILAMQDGERIKVWVWNRANVAHMLGEIASMAVKKDSRK